MTEPTPQQILDRWTEKDLSTATLSPLYERDDLVLRALGILASGRSLMVLGPPGTGKTALVHELVRRSRAGHSVPALDGRRVVQISLRAVLTTLQKPDEFGPAFSQFIQALFAMRGELVPFIRDAALAYRLDVESQLLALAEGMDGPVILEGDENEMKALLEYEPAIARAYLPLVVEEPSLATVERIVARWSEASDSHIDPAAQRMSIELCHRFLARDRFPRKALQLLDQAAHTRQDLAVIDQSEVLDQFCGVHQVPRHLVDPEVVLDLATIERHFRERLLGQGDAVAAVVQMISLVKAGLSDVRRPFGVFLFVGPTGVGKTHLAQLLADYLFGSPDRLVRLNMADFQSPHDAMALFGNPEHHRLSARRGVLTTRLAGHPFAVLLFDELEKAHETVIDRFLQLMDEGAFINGAGETVSCRSNIVIATSNAGAQIYGGRMIGFAGQNDALELDRKVDLALEGVFRREFLNRFDQVVHFRPLTRAHIRDIARRELRLLKERPGLARRDLHLEVDEPVLDWLTTHGYDPRHGARFLRRVVERHVATAVAKAIMRAAPTQGQTLRLTVRHGAILALPVDLPPVAGPTPIVDEPGSVDWADRARSVLSEAGPLRQELTEARAQRSALLERINGVDFWKSDDRVAVLARFKTLDVQVEGDQRDAQAIERLDERVAAGRFEPHGVRAAESALLAWQERRALDSADRVWLVLSRGDALDEEADPFLADLLQIEESWCRHCGLDAERVAVDHVEGHLHRVVLEVHGPAAEAMLAAEVGLHRLHRTDGPDRRVAVAVIPAGTAESSETHMASRKRRIGPFDVALHVRGQLDRPGRSITLEGTDAEVVAQATADLLDGWDALHPTEIARIYAADGVGGRDPRTSASVKRFKDLRRGQLQTFREAWVRSQR